MSGSVAALDCCSRMTDLANVRNCVILARGLGTRMRKEDDGAKLDEEQSLAAAEGLKALIPVGRPFLDYVLSALADSGISRVCLVIGPEHQQIRQYYTSTRLSRLEVSFAIQLEPRGTADAVLAAEQFVGNDEFVVLNGDNYYPSEALQLLQELDGPGAVLFEADTLVKAGNISMDRIRNFAYATVDADGYLTDIVEKPTEANVPSLNPQQLVSMNCWRLARPIYPSLRDVPVSPRGEFELSMAIQMAIKSGVRLRAAISNAGVLDLSRRSDIATVSAKLKNMQAIL
jgi:glucose-1-phosphate thymidylyltransferase